MLMAMAFAERKKQWRLVSPLFLCWLLTLPYSFGCTGIGELWSSSRLRPQVFPPLFCPQFNFVIKWFGSQFLNKFLIVETCMRISVNLCECLVFHLNNMLLYLIPRFLNEYNVCMNVLVCVDCADRSVALSLVVCPLILKNNILLTLIVQFVICDYNNSMLFSSILSIWILVFKYSSWNKTLESFLMSLP